MRRTIGLVTTNYTIDGFGTLTDERPPASLPFGGRYRLMDFALSNLVNARITTVGLITPHYYRSIVDHVGAGKEWGLDRKRGGLFNVEFLARTETGVARTALVTPFAPELHRHADHLVAGLLQEEGRDGRINAAGKSDGDLHLDVPADCG